MIRTIRRHELSSGASRLLHYLTDLDADYGLSTRSVIVLANELLPAEHILVECTEQMAQLDISP